VDNDILADLVDRLRGTGANANEGAMSDFLSILLPHSIPVLHFLTIRKKDLF
jgi:hypothetical protein